MIKQGQTVYMVIIDRVGAKIHKVFVRDNFLAKELNGFKADGKMKIYASKRKAAFGAKMFTDMLKNGVFGRTLMQQASAALA